MSFYNTETLYNYAKAIDYSLNSSSSIDDRVLQVCQQAERNFLENKKSIKEIESMKKTDGKFKKSINNTNASASVGNANPDLRLIENFVKSDYVINNKSSGVKIFDEKFNTRKNENIEQYYINPNKSIEFDKKFVNTSNKMEFQNSNFRESKEINKDKDKYRLLFKHKHLKSGRKCVKCEITKK